jgi:pSer/pThr/pTyr-binding forkhead associated (FHA) protein
VGGYAIRLAGPPRALDAPSWQLIFEIEPRGGAAERQTRVFRRDHVWIGRGSACDISLPRSNASRRHCYVTVRPDGAAFVADGGSTNGTWLNGERISGPTPLAAGDKIYVGNYHISLARPPERIG